MRQAAERRFKKAQELEWSFQTPEGSNAALCWLNAEEEKKKINQEMTHAGTVFLQVSPASPLFTLTVLLHN